MPTNSDLTFDEWVSQIFDKPVTDPQWFFLSEYDGEPKPLPPIIEAEYMTLLFEKPAFLVSRYSEGQIAHGLEYLLHNSSSDCVFHFVEQAIPEQIRVRLAHSLFFLFKDLLAVICSDYCGGPDHPDRRPADYVCFMMWDAGTLQIYPDRPEQQKIDKAMLDTLVKILALPQRCCQKSALHGLGHAHLDYPDKVREIINKYLASNLHLDEDLYEYALDAREGAVL